MRTVVARRFRLSGLLGAAALAPAAIWLAPALLFRRAPTWRDQADFFFPLKLYTADRLASGQVPHWNPLSGLGEPWLANGQSGVFYPPTLLFLIPSPGIAAGLFLLLHFAIGAAGAWRFLKEEAVSESGAALGAAAFAGCGFAASLSAYWNHFGAWAYLPWIALLARTGLRSSRSRAGLAAVVGLSAMAGSPEIAAAGILVAFLFAFEDRPREPDWRELPAGKRIVVAAGSIGLGLAFAAWILVPMGELALSSDRRMPLPGSERDRGASGAGAVFSAVGLSEGRGGDYLSSLHAGPLLLCAAAGAFLEGQRRRLALVLAGVALFGALASAAGPPGPWIRSLPFLDRARYPAKWLAWTFLALPLLAGLGADAWRFARGRGRALVLCGIGLAGLLVLLFSRRPIADRLVEGIGLAALILSALAAAGKPAAAPDVRGAALGFAAAVALSASLALASWPLFRFCDESEIRRVPESIPFLSAVAGRVLTPPSSALVPWVLRDSSYDAKTLRRQREALLGYTNLTAKVAAVRSAAALPTLGQRRIADGIDGGKNPLLPAGAAGARLLWTPFQPENLGSRKVGDFFRAPLNPYRPRLSFVSGYGVERDAGRAWDRAVAENDWSRRVFLDREPSPRPEASARRSYVVARIAEDLPERVTADVNSDATGLLVLADLHYPGWSVLIDGQPAPMLRADGYLRAVAVVSGSHRVVFRYRPDSFYAGAAVSILAGAVVLAMLWRG